MPEHARYEAQTMGLTMFNATLEDDEISTKNQRATAFTQLGSNSNVPKPSTAPGHKRLRTYNFASNKETGTAALDNMESPSSARQSS